jgi:tetraacyldisaccharide 4'-kinase
LPDGPVVAFCGIGNAEAFFGFLRREGFQLAEARSFRDHHYYTQDELDRLTEEARNHGARLITTAKDAVKLKSLQTELPCYVVSIRIDIDGQAELIQAVLNSIQT